MQHTCPLTAQMSPAQAYQLSLSASSKRSAKSLLSNIAKIYDSSLDEFDWAGINPMWVLNTMTLLEQRGLGYATVNVYLSMIKGVARAAWRMDLMHGDIYAKIKDVSARRGYRMPVGRVIVETEINAMMDECRNNQTLHGSRDALILMIGFYMGLRISEIGALKMSNIDVAQRQIRVIGKGNKERCLPIPSKVMVYLDALLRVRHGQKQVYQLRGDYLFGSMSTGKTRRLADLDGISASTIDKRFRAVWQSSDTLNYYSCPTPHDMRRTALTRWMDKTGDVRIAQALAGHSNIQTTIGYSRSDLFQRMVEAVELEQKDS